MTVLLSVVLAVAVAAVAVSVLGVLLARDAFDGLHYLGPAVLVGGPALVVATLVHDGVGLVAGRTALVVLIAGVAGPVLTHATARAGLARGDAARLRADELSAPVTDDGPTAAAP